MLLYGKQKEMNDLQDALKVWYVTCKYKHEDGGWNAKDLNIYLELQK
jgi:hypothetical protein